MTSPAPLIEDLFYQGHPLDHIVTVGTDVGWSRDDVMAVLREHQWDLDGSGRLPRSKRVTTPRGLRGLRPATVSAPPPPPEPAPAPAAAPEPAPAKLRQPKPIEHGTHRGVAGHKRNGVPVPDDDSCGCRKAKRDQQAAYQRGSYRRKHPKPEVPPTPEEADEAAREAWSGVIDDEAEAAAYLAATAPEPDPAPPVDLNDWLAAAQRSPRPTVQRRAATALVVLLQLHIALDDLARAERAEGHAR